MIHVLIAWLHWNPQKEVFHIPFINHPVVWYGLWFVFGFIVGYFFLIFIFQKQLAQLEISLPKRFKTTREAALYLVDRLTWFMVAGTVIGARLGHVFFYDWPKYKDHLGNIFKTWEGGLASHGAAVGILISLWLYQRLIRKEFPQFSFLILMDMLAIPTAFIACCIRIGNFFNQEILGTSSQVPWAIIFDNPADRSVPIPRHPVQLYEAGAYLLTFFFLGYLWRYQFKKLKPGMMSGIFFICVFTSRFFLEFLKMPQGLVLDESFLQTGQYLSIPFIVVGLFLLLKSKCANKLR